MQTIEGKTVSMKKLAPYGVTAGVALAAILLLNTFAKRSATVAKVRNTVNQGL